MRITTIRRVVAVASLLSLSLSLAVMQADAAAAVVSVTAVLVAGLVAAQLSAAAATTAMESPGVGRRARAHRQSLDMVPEPQHPHTAGRPRTRAPARRLAIA